MTRVICLANNKGGVGKTNVSVNLPVFLAAKGKRTLLIDFDHQANATFSLGVNPKNVPLSIYHSLVGQISPSSIIHKTPFFGYELIPSSADLAGAVVELVGMKNREFRLQQVVDKLKDDYDYIVIDLPPSLDLLTLNGLVASDEVLIPVQCEYLALEGLDQLLSTVELVRDNIGKDLKIAGALMTMYNRGNRLSRNVAKEIRRNFPGYVFDTVIPRSVKLAEAPKEGVPILKYAPNSKAAIAYRELAEELIKREKI
jgi:chromosome partitioning protein